MEFFHDEVLFWGSNGIKLLRIGTYELIISIEAENVISATIFNNRVVGIIKDGVQQSKIVFYDKNTGLLVSEFSYNEYILSVRGNSSYLFISSENTIEAFQTTPFKSVEKYYRTSKNGSFALSSQYCVWTDDSQPGKVYLVSISDMKSILEVQCHKGEIKKLSLSEQSLLLATASRKGTIIRVFNPHNGKQISEYRRGFSRADILALDITSDALCAITSSTIHIFPKEGGHITVPPIGNAVSIRLSNNRLFVLMDNGSLQTIVFCPTSCTIESSQTIALPF